MSLVMPEPSLGTMQFIAQVLPPSLETKMGARFGPQNPWLGVKADPATWRGLAGLTARFGSLSWLVSPLWAKGIMLTTVTWAAWLSPAPATSTARMLAIHHPRCHRPGVVIGRSPRDIS